MLSKDGGVEADITVSVLENGDGSSVVKPKFEGLVYTVISDKDFILCSVLIIIIFNIVIIIIN